MNSSVSRSAKMRPSRRIVNDTDFLDLNRLSHFLQLLSRRFHENFQTLYDWKLKILSHWFVKLFFDFYSCSIETEPKSIQTVDFENKIYCESFMKSRMNSILSKKNNLSFHRALGDVLFRLEVDFIFSSRRQTLKKTTIIRFRSATKDPKNQRNWLEKSFAYGNFSTLKTW